MSQGDLRKIHRELGHTRLVSSIKTEPGGEALLDGYEASIKKAEDAKKAKEEEAKAKACAQGVRSRYCQLMHLMNPSLST
jgi:hypothetical protein